MSRAVLGCRTLGELALDPFHPVHCSDALEGVEGGGPGLLGTAQVPSRGERKSALVHHFAAKQGILGHCGQGHSGAEGLQSLGRTVGLPQQRPSEFEGGRAAKLVLSKLSDLERTVDRRCRRRHVAAPELQLSDVRFDHAL